MKYIRKVNVDQSTARNRRKIYKRQKLTAQYFAKYHLGESGSYKQDNARYKIYHVFDKWYFDRTSVRDLGTHYAPKDRYDCTESFPFDLDKLIFDLETVLPELNY